MDLNPIPSDYNYHMHLRRLISSQEAIAAYFTKTSEVYNKIYDRYELYSEPLNITVYNTLLNK